MSRGSEVYMYYVDYVSLVVYISCHSNSLCLETLRENGAATSDAKYILQCTMYGHHYYTYSKLCVCMYMYMCVHMCVHACTCAFVCVCVCVCVCVQGRQKQGGAGAALAALQFVKVLINY